jgi:2-oxoglutarate ferredoxin oxidoreductase subunit gamma
MWKLIFSGVGGQGIISAGILIGEAAVIYEGRHAVQTQSYGAEMRGGLSRADVTIADEQVMYPKVTQAHVLVCMHQKALNATLGLIRPGGVLIADRNEVTVDRSTDARYFELPLSERVLSELGTTRSANICMLGALVSLTRVVAPDSLRAAISERFGDAEEALAAFELGRGMVEGQVLSQIG